MVIGMYEDGEFTSITKKIDEKLGGQIKESVEIAGLKGKEGEKLLILNTKNTSIPKRIALVGIGSKAEDMNERKENARVAAGK